MKMLGPISLDQRAVYEDRLARYPTVLSEQTFTNMFMWSDSHPFQALDADDSLVLFDERDRGVVLVGSPIGPIPLAEAAREVEGATGKKVAGFERIGEARAHSVPGQGWQIEEEADLYDYVYRREDLAELAGRRYHSKRNLIAQCLAEYDCTYEEISPKNLHELRPMMDRWCDWRRCRDDRGLCSEYRAVKTVLEEFDNLSVTGAAIRIDGRIEAFTVGQRLNENTAVIHVEKAMPQFKGLYQLINHWYCKNGLSRFEFVNREQDVGIPGLRKAKESYHPDHMVKKFVIFPRGERDALGPRRRAGERCLDEEG
ncbi:MAG: DUF2156 domain-containing protein [Proteobacteria bacterium]|nr:DUF2156 domain-containing protein [Pseudomonadota bacterium]